MIARKIQNSRLTFPNFCRVDVEWHLENKINSFQMDVRLLVSL